MEFKRFDTGTLQTENWKQVNRRLTLEVSSRSDHFAMDPSSCRSSGSQSPEQGTSCDIVPSEPRKPTRLGGEGLEVTLWWPRLRSLRRWRRFRRFRVRIGRRSEFWIGGGLRYVTSTMVWCSYSYNPWPQKKKKHSVTHDQAQQVLIVTESLVYTQTRRLVIIKGLSMRQEPGKDRDIPTKAFQKVVSEWMILSVDLPT